MYLYLTEYANGLTNNQTFYKFQFLLKLINSQKKLETRKIEQTKGSDCFHICLTLVNSKSNLIKINFSTFFLPHLKIVLWLPFIKRFFFFFFCVCAWFMDCFMWLDHLSGEDRHASLGLDPKIYSWVDTALFLTRVFVGNVSKG